VKTEPEDSRNTKGANALRTGPLFILSMWRGGSSLLYLLLNKHPQIALLYEADLPGLQPLFLAQRGRTSWAERWELWNQSLSRHGISAADIPPGLNDARAATRAVYGEYARRKGATIWGEKTPNFCDRVDLLARDFPEASFIIIWRNPIATARSIARAAALDARFFQKRGMQLRAIHGYARMKSQCDALNAVGRRVYQLNYEDLTRNTAAILRDICSFLSIPFDSRTTSLDGADRSALFPGEHHRMLHGDSIVSGRESADLLTPDLKRKLECYIVSWREQNGGVWPAYPKAAENGVKPVGAEERASDWLVYHAALLLHSFRRVFYSLMPLPALKKYRTSKHAAKSTAHIQSPGRSTAD